MITNKQIYTFNNKSNKHMELNKNNTNTSKERETPKDRHIIHNNRNTQ